MSVTATWQRSSFRTRLAVIVAVGGAWRLAYVVATKWGRSLLLNDSLYYSWQALGLVHGEYFKDIFGKAEAAEHGPLTSIVLAPVSFGAHAVDLQRLVTCVLGIVTVALVGVLGRRLGGERVGLIAASIAALYPNLWINDGLVMSESLGAMLVVLIMLALDVVLRDGEQDDGGSSVRRAGVHALVLGALVGLGALTRSELVLAVPFAAIAIVRTIRPWRRAVVPIVAGTVATLVVLAPWVAYNQSRFTESVTLSTNDGTTLIGANCPETYSSAALGGWSLFCVLDVQGPPGADDSVRARIQRETAIDYARDHLGRLPLVALARLGRTIDVFEVGNLVHQDVGEEKARWAVWTGIASWWVLAPLAVVGLVRMRDRRSRRVLLVPITIVLVTSVVFYGTHRLRVTMEPAVVIAAALAIGGVLAERRDDQAGDSGLPGRGEGAVGVADVDPSVGRAGVEPEATLGGGARFAEQP